MGHRPETLCGPMLSSLFTLQNSLCHRRMQPTRHEEGAERRRKRRRRLSSSELAVEAEQQSQDTHCKGWVPRISSYSTSTVMIIKLLLLLVWYSSYHTTTGCKLLYAQRDPLRESTRSHTKDFVSQLQCRFSQSDCLA